MMKLLDISKKYGETTHKYPFEPYKVAENFRGKPSYIFDLCIGCAACGVACPSNAITVQFNDSKSKLIWEFDCGRCIFCGYCAEVCPELAIVHGIEYENASEQRAHFGLKEDMLTPLDTFRANEQKEFPGFGALSDNADEAVKQTPLAY